MEYQRGTHSRASSVINSFYTTNGFLTKWKSDNAFFSLATP